MYIRKEKLTTWVYTKNHVLICLNLVGTNRNCFYFENKFYLQKEGFSMGSPISPF